MSSMVDHYLRCVNIKKMLLDAGVIVEKTLHGTGGREVHFEHVLNLQKCCAEEWEKSEQRAIEHGVVDYAKTNPDGSSGVRRDLTEQEIDELRYWPIEFSKDDEVNWLCKWNNNDDPAFFISKLFSDHRFEYEIFCECDWCGNFYVKDGDFEPTEKWKAHMEEITQEYDDCVVDDDETLPF